MKAECNKKKKKQELAALACADDKNSSKDESFDEPGIVMRCEGFVQPSGTSQEQVSFCEYVRVKGYCPEHNVAEGQIKTVALDNDLNP